MLGLDPVSYTHLDVYKRQVYGSSKNPFHLQGQTLHAMILGFLHPVTGEYMEFEAPLPDYFLKLLEKLRK